MSTYIVAPSRSAFDGVIRSMKLDRRETVYINSARQTRGLILQPGQVIYADGSESLSGFAEILDGLNHALNRGVQRSSEDKRTHRLTVTDLDGNTVGTRLVTERQAKDALG